MKCPTCQKEIPDSASGHPLLACPNCMAAKSYQALLDFERQFITSLRRGEHPVTLAKPAGWHRWHLILMPYPQTWCSAPVHAQWDQKRRPYPAIDRKVTPLCEACVKVFEALEETPTEVA